MSDDTKSLHAKLRKLLAMAEHPTTNPNEAANAAAMAARLAVEANIDLDAIRDAPPKSFVRGMLDWNYPARDGNAVITLTQWVAQTFGCKILMHGGSRLFISFSGQQHNVDLCKSWATYLWEACKRANSEHARKEKRPTFKEREDARSAFRVHFCYAVAARLREKLDELKAQGVQGSATAGTSLVVSAWFEQERKEVEAWMNATVTYSSKAMKTRDTKYVASAAAAGKDAGMRVSLNKQIA